MAEQIPHPHKQQIPANNVPDTSSDEILSPSHLTPSHVAHMLHLQRSLGNRYTTSLIRNERQTTEFSRMSTSDRSISRMFKLFKGKGKKEKAKEKEKEKKAKEKEKEKEKPQEELKEKEKEAQPSPEKKSEQSSAEKTDQQSEGDNAQIHANQADIIINNLSEKKFNLEDLKGWKGEEGNVYGKGGVYVLETAIKYAHLQAVEAIYEILVANKISLESQEVPGRPVYWLGAICTSAQADKQDEDYVPIVKYLEGKMGIRPITRDKREYLEAVARAEPKTKGKVDFFINHFYLNYIR